MEGKINFVYFSKVIFVNKNNKVCTDKNIHVIVDNLSINYKEPYSFKDSIVRFNNGIIVFEEVNFIVDNVPFGIIYPDLYQPIWVLKQLYDNKDNDVNVNFNID